MKRGRTTILLLGLAGLLTVGLGMPAAVQAAAPTQDLVRLSGDFKNFDGTETTASPSVNVFSKSVLVPAVMTALYITTSATGDTTGEGTVLELRCQVDASDCHPSGYLAFQKQPTTRRDNGIYHTWCIGITPPTSPTTKTVTIDMQATGGEVALEAAHLFVDASDLASDACHNLDD
jgi:hypothetical protein